MQKQLEIKMDPAPSKAMVANKISYPGGKNGSGTYQQLINLIPPHDVFISTFLGHCGVMAHKKQARINIGIDMDINVTDHWKSQQKGNIKNDGVGSITIINGDALAYLLKYPFLGNEFVYADPPYLRGRQRYLFKFGESNHVELLNILKRIPCKIMISGYDSSLYNEIHSNWHKHSFWSMTRRGRVMETVWMNYPTPTKLHDYSFLGDDYRERERIRKKKNRWVKRLESLPTLEKNAILEALMHGSNIIKNDDIGQF